jgi:hypothetical protein
MLKLPGHNSYDHVPIITRRNEVWYIRAGEITTCCAGLEAGTLLGS